MRKYSRRSGDLEANETEYNKEWGFVMAINRAEIKNFTVFDDMAIDFDNGVNVIIGENGTGKTHLLKLLYAFCNCSYGKSEESGKTTAEKDMLSLLFNYFNSAGDIDLFFQFQNLMEFKFYTHEETQGFSWKVSKRPDGGTEYNSRNYLFDKDVIPSVYIPAKEMLTHSKGLLEMTKKYSGEIPFDKTILDIIEKSRQSKLDEITSIAKNIVPALERIIGGKITVENDTFFVQKPNNKKIAFSSETEGIKKIGLLWQLLMNGAIGSSTVLLWDEPEANINPKLISDLVEILLELSRNGIQIFVSTHDYIFAKYFEVKRRENDSVIFHSLYKTGESVRCESNGNFRDLENNSLIAAFDELMDEVINVNMGD